MVFVFAKPYENARKLFACKLKNTLYNVDIRVRGNKRTRKWKT
jgi:hypothetical protein